MSMHPNLFFNNKYKLHQKTSLWFVAYACIVTWLLPCLEELRFEAVQS